MIGVAARLADGIGSLSRRLRWLLFATPLVLLFLYFGYHAVHGQRGLIAFLEMRREVQRLAAQRDELRAQRDELARRVRQLDPSAVDPDLLEQELKELGYVHKDEVIVLEAPR